ncbi:hypothetical protein KIL84_020412 [Mauremys mutica]|uniref:Uncharacterized protein n=1 Tax=Mauremys mutica TaxID=74926 RepID=A0A9D4BAX8_9SAUR|nr:hypothetical protein KIL84_020412 [Mauremys mutica]
MDSALCIEDITVKSEQSSTFHYQNKFSRKLICTAFALLDRVYPRPHVIFSLPCKTGFCFFILIWIEHRLLKPCNYKLLLKAMWVKTPNSTDEPSFHCPKHSSPRCTIMTEQGQIIHSDTCSFCLEGKSCGFPTAGQLSFCNDN